MAPAQGVHCRCTRPRPGSRPGALTHQRSALIWRSAVSLPAAYPEYPTSLKSWNLVGSRAIFSQGDLGIYSAQLPCLAEPWVCRSRTWSRPGGSPASEVGTDILGVDIDRVMLLIGAAWVRPGMHTSH